MRQKLKSVERIILASTFKLVFFVFLCLGFLISPINSISQDLIFDNLVLQSGTDKQVGAVYLQTLAAPGIDATITIVDLTGGTTIQTFDDNGTAEVDAFQPVVVKSSTLLDEYARFQVDLFVTGTSTPVSISNAEVNAVDIDGSAPQTEYVTFYYADSYTVEATTQLTVTELSNGIRFDGPTGGPAGIDYTQTDWIGQVDFNSVSSFLIDVGSVDISAWPARQASIYFKSIVFSSPMVVISTENGLCGNSIDDDGDGLTDCDDPDCGVSVTDFTNGQAAIEVYGQPNFTTGGSGLTDSEFYRVNDIEEDPTTGKIFVCDQKNNRILRFGTISDLLDGNPAEAVLGQVDFVTNTSGTSQSKFNEPHSLAIDASGNLFVSDNLNNRILRFDNASSKGNGANADGVLGQVIFTSSGSGLAQNKFFRPAGIHVDDSGTLWVSDGFNNRIIKHVNAASKADGANADGVLGRPNYGFTPTSCTQSLTGIVSGISMYNGSLYVGDSSHNRIMIWDDASSKSDGANADRVLGQNDFVTSTYTLSQSSIANANGLDFDSHGNLYVADGPPRILIFNDAVSKSNGSNGDAVLGQPDFVTSGTGTSATALFSPYGTYHFDYNNQTYLACADKLNHRIIFWSQTVITDELTNVSGTLHGSDLANTGSLTFSISQQPALGTVAIDDVNAGTYTYSPTGPCMLDSDSIVKFKYSVTNGNGCSDTGTLSIDISNVSDCEEICGNAIDDDWDGRTDEPYPANVSENCILWLKADQGFGGGFWLDQSREGNDATVFGDPTQVSNSMNFNDAINFDGDDYVEVNLPELRFDGGTHHVVIFAVYEPSTTATNIGIFGNQLTSNGTIEMYNNSIGLGFGSLAMGIAYGDSPHLITYVIDEENNVAGVPFSSPFYHNGGLIVSNTFNETNINQTSNTFHIGRSGTFFGSQYFLGDIQELIIYYEDDGNPSISDAERQQIESYLATKYGITLNHDYTDSQ